MFFMDTWQLFFEKEARKDFLWLVIGLVGMMTFSMVMMEDWLWVFFLSTMIACSSVYRFIMVDQAFYKNDVRKLNASNVIDFVISKNVFCFIFLLFISVSVILVSTLFDGHYFDQSLLIQIITYNLFILGSENIIYIFHRKPVEGYAAGGKREADKDIKVGFKNFIDQIPSLIVLSLFSILFFILRINPSFSFGLIYFVLCLISLISYEKKIRSDKI